MTAITNTSDRIGENRVPVGAAARAVVRGIGQAASGAGEAIAFTARSFSDAGKAENESRYGHGGSELSRLASSGIVRRLHHSQTSGTMAGVEKWNSYKKGNYAPPVVTELVNVATSLVRGPSKKKRSE